MLKMDKLHVMDLYGRKSSFPFSLHRDGGSTHLFLFPLLPCARVLPTKHIMGE